MKTKSFGFIGGGRITRIFLEALTNKKISLDKILDTVSSDTVVISLAPKITIDKIASKLKTKKIVRMIPNATSYINEGYNSLTFSADFVKSEKLEVLNLLKLLGTTFEVAE